MLELVYSFSVDNFFLKQCSKAASLDMPSPTAQVLHSRFPPGFLLQNKLGLSKSRSCPQLKVVTQAGTAGTELLEVSSRQGATETQDMLRAAGRGEGRGGAGREVKPETNRNARIEDKMRNGATRVSFSVTVFHMVEPLFKRPITL